MKRILTITLALVFLILSGCTKQSQPEPLSTAEVVAKVGPSVVQIVTADGTGSGIFLDTAGHVLTNNHVVEEAASANIVLSDGRTLLAQIVNRDWLVDLAVLKVATSDLQPATLGSSSKVQLGEDVITLGYPLNLGSSVTVTKGIVSAFRPPYLQTDAPVNPGNSGGPLVNMWGEVIGLVTAKPQTQGQEPTEGIGFAIAVDQINDVLVTLLSPQNLSSLTEYATVTGTQGSEHSLLSVDAFGNVHCVWGEHPIGDVLRDQTARLMYSARSSGGGWADSEIMAENILGDCGGLLIGPYVSPQAIAVDSESTVHVLWIQNHCRVGLGTDLFYATKPLGQTWSTPTLLSGGTTFSATRLAVDSAETLHLVCAASHCADIGVGEPGIYYLYKPKHGMWSQPDLIVGSQQSDLDCPESPTLGCDSQGNLWLAYYYSYSASRTLARPIYLARKPAGAPWTVPTRIPEAEGVIGLQLLVDSGDNVCLAFQDVHGRTACSSLLPDQSMSAIRYLSGADHRCTNIRLGSSASGTMYAVWERQPNPEDTGGSIIVCWKSPGNPWSSEHLVHRAAVGTVVVNSFVVDSTGNAHFLINGCQPGSDPSEPWVCHESYLTLDLGQVMN